MLKRPLNHSEVITHRLLIKGLEGTSISVIPQQKLQQIIDPSDLPLTRAEYLYWRQGSFDFIAIDEDGLPNFAVDFDGPIHFIEKKRAADVRKMAICSKACLPIAKIDDDYITEHEHSTILEFMVTRFLRWITEYPKYESIFMEEANKLSAEGKTADEIQDWLISPEMEFDFAYPYPGIEIVRKRLREEHNLLPEYLTPTNGNVKSEYHMESKLTNSDENGYIKGYARYCVKGIAKKGEQSIPILWTPEAWTRAKWVFRKELEPEEFKTHFGKTAMEMNEQMWKEHGFRNVKYCASYYSGLPGLSVPDTVETLSEYKCLKIIEDLSSKLKESGWTFLNGTPLDIF